MRRSVLLLLLGVLLPGFLSHRVYARLLGERSHVLESDMADRPGPIEVRITEVAPAAPVPWEDRACRVTEERVRTLSAAASDRIRIRAGTGSLRVRGVEGGGEIRVRALLCASDVERLLDLEVGLRRVMGPDVAVETVQPVPDGSHGWSDDEYARIDLVLEVPAGISTAIEHAGGPVRVSGVGSLTVRDGAGDVEALDVGGDVAIDDGAGGVRLHSVGGDVLIEDGSGPVEVAGVGGSLVVTGGTEQVTVSGVAGEVRVPGTAVMRSPAATGSAASWAVGEGGPGGG